MHLIIAAIMALGGLAWAINQLLNGAADAKGAVRRLKWQHRHGKDLVAAIDDPRIAAVILLGLAWVTQKAPSKRLAAASDAQVRALASLETTLRNAEAVRAMGMERDATGAWRAANDESLKAGYAAGNFGAVISNATKTFRMGVQILITGLGAWLVIQGEMSMGAIIAVNILAGKALAPFDAGVAIYQSVVTLRKARGRLEAVFALEDEAAGNLELPEPEGAVSVSGVGYQAPGNGPWLLKGVSLEIGAGASLGVIGPSGGGKTTLARLLVGVKQATTGAVAIDGAAIGQWRPDQLSAALGYLPQDVELFTGTVAENIARMNPEADDAAIVAAAQLAEVHDFILALPGGYQTPIGENGAATAPMGVCHKTRHAACAVGARGTTCPYPAVSPVRRSVPTAQNMSCRPIFSGRAARARISSSIHFTPSHRPLSSP